MPKSALRRKGIELPAASQTSREAHGEKSAVPKRGAFPPQKTELLSVSCRRGRTLRGFRSAVVETDNPTILSDVRSLTAMSSAMPIRVLSVTQIRMKSSLIPKSRIHAIRDAMSFQLTEGL